MAYNTGSDDDVRITFYDVANQTEGTERVPAAVAKKSEKHTINLCRKERKGISLVLFCAILIGILAVLLLIEFFGAYRPYKDLEAKEAQLAAQRAELDELNAGLKDMDEVRANYRKYNYENFPFDIVNREDILALIKEVVFPYGKVASVSISSNTLSMTVNGIQQADVTSMLEKFYASDIVDGAPVSNTTYNSDGTASLAMTIRFKNSNGGN